MTFYLESLLSNAELRKLGDDVAEAIVQVLAIDAAEGKKYSIASKEGEGPGTDQAKWKALLRV